MAHIKKNENTREKKQNYVRKERTHNTNDRSNDNKNFDKKAGKPGAKNNFKKPLLDDKKEQDEYHAIFDQIKAENSKILEINAQLQALTKGVKYGNNEKRQPLLQKRKELLNQKADISNEIENLKAQKNANDEILRNAKLPVKPSKGTDVFALNSEKYDEQIREIDNSIQFGSLNLSEEKRKITEREKIVKSKAALDKLKKVYEQVEEQKAQLNAKRDELKVVLDELSEIYKQLGADNEEKEKQKKTESEKQEITESLNARKAEHSANIVKLKEKAAAKKEEIDAMWTAWKAQQAIEREKRKEDYEKQKIEREQKKKEYIEAKEKAKKEREEERRKLEEEKLPFVEEVALADRILAYLSTLKYPKNKPKLPFKHQIDSYCLFDEFSVVPPSCGAELDACRAKVQAKKDEFLEKQRLEVVLREEKKAAEAAKAAENKEESNDNIEIKEVVNNDNAVEAKEESKAEETAPEEKKEESS